jgi:uracil-DNA glycosylase family protein
MAKAVKRSLPTPASAGESPQTCRRCDLWRHATQAVEGEGSPSARFMLVGEQPGDEEDLRGHPFVGPAGKVLDQAIAAAGLERHDVFITNAVKHFKWEPRGKRRLHKRPGIGKINACHVWLEQEIAAVKPAVIVALGATALRALTGATLFDRQRPAARTAPSQRLPYPLHVPSLSRPACRRRAGGGAADVFGRRLARGGAVRCIRVTVAGLGSAAVGSARIRIEISGWRYAPSRGTFPFIRLA